MVWPVFLQRPRGKVVEKLRWENDQSGENSTHLCCWIYLLESTQDAVSYIFFNIYFVGTGKFQVFCMIKDVTTVASISWDLGIQTPQTTTTTTQFPRSKPPSIWMILKDLRYTQAWRLTAGTCPHGGLVQIMFLSKWVICRLHETVNLPVFQRVESHVPWKLTVGKGRLSFLGPGLCSGAMLVFVWINIRSQSRCPSRFVKGVAKRIRTSLQRFVNALAR